MILRGRWVESLLAATAILVAGWPVGDLVAAQPWVWPLVWILVLIIAVGGLTRGVGSPGWVVVLAQGLTALTALAWMVQRGSDAAAPGAAAAPGESFLAAAVRLVEEGSRTIAEFPVPAPATPGLVFIVLASLVLLALLVDAIGVTARAPAMAGVPLLLMGALTASSSGEPLHPRYFLATAAAWLVLLARHGRTDAERWVERSAARTTVDPRAAVSGAARRSGTVARSLGALALVAAVLVPTTLPHLPPTVLIDGLSRTGSGTTGTVSFTETLDLAQDLADRSRAPVIRYRTDTTSPEPLRVTATDHYVGGRWLPSEEPTFATDGTQIGTLNAYLLDLAELEPRTVETTVLQNGLRAPQLAMPYPPSRIDVGEIPLAWDPRTESLQVESAPESYEITSLDMGPLGTLPEHIGAAPERLIDRHDVVAEEDQPDGFTLRFGPDQQLLEVVHPDGTRDLPMTDGSMIRVADGEVVRSGFGWAEAGMLDVDPASAEVVTALAAELAGELNNEIDIAQAIQRYLRGPDFTYSLTLADPVEGPDGEPLDPISHFLATRQGYCTQFASAMVMMARAQGIPARMAVGFLPGTAGLDGTRTVVAADAHAWPELFITGLGWTRFEPTPGDRSGSAPLYQSADAAQAAEPTPEAPTAEEPTVDAPVPDTADGQGASDDAGWFARHGETLRTGLLVAVGIVLLGSVLPLAARWHRYRLRRGHGAATGPVEGQWAVLVSGLEDLGVAPRPALSLRGQSAYYADELAPDAPALDALRRASGRVEAARYTPQGAPPGTMAEDVRQVLTWRYDSLPRRRRLLAALAPLSGRRLLGLAAPPVAARATIGG